ncbi:hypothetical protein Vretifemale_6946 [Volvox reticuliferus]|uniref:Uncharacterized protein n=1 Tax=Volvox reticuliferus TaxID=1737510 RepID=A0A8J4CB27_9CHLO|nr:hypothetical protein Vretifemale_6946 [Volvox reticuliferus]
MIRNRCYFVVIIINIYFCAHLPRIALSIRQLRTRRDARDGDHGIRPNFGALETKLGRHDLAGSSVLYNVSNVRRVAIATMPNIPVRISATVTPVPTLAIRDSQLQAVTDSLRNATFAKSVLVSVAAKLVRANVTLARGAFIRDCSYSSREDYKARLGAAVGLSAADVLVLCVERQDVAPAQDPAPPVCSPATTLLVMDTTLRLQPAAKESDVQAALAALPGGNAELHGLCVPSRSYMPQASVLLNAVLVMPDPRAVYADIAATTATASSGPPRVSHGDGGGKAGATAIRLDETDSGRDIPDAVRWALVENLRQAIATALRIPPEQVQLHARSLIIGNSPSAQSLQPPHPSLVTARALTAAVTFPGAATEPPSLSFRGGGMHQQLGRGHPWILQVIVSTSAGAAVVISMMLVSCLWARWRRDSDPEPRAAYSSRGGRSVIFHSLGPTREAGAMASSELASASAAPITEELRKYMAPTQPEASASASVEAVATASFTAATGSAAIAAVAATAAAVSNDTDDRAPTENASCQERVSCSVLTQPDRGEGVPEGSGGSSGGGSALVSPDGDLSRGDSLAEQNSGAIIAAANSPRVAEATSPSQPSSPATSPAANATGGSVLAARRPLQPQPWLPLPLPMSRTGPYGRVSQQQHQHQQALLKWAALRRLIEEKRVEAEAPPASPSLPPITVGAWTAPAPAIGSDRLKSIELPYVEDGMTAVPSGTTLGEVVFGQRGLSADTNGASGTPNSGAGSGSGPGTGSTGLLARVFSRKSRSSGSQALVGPEGRGNQVMQTCTGATYYANAGGSRGDDARLSQSSSSAVSVGSPAAATKKRRLQGRRRPSREAVVAFGVDDAERGSRGTAVIDDGGGDHGEDDTDAASAEVEGDDDIDDNYDRGAQIPGSPSRDGRPSAGTFLAAAAWGVALPPSARSLQPRLSAAQDTNGVELLFSERRRPQEGKRYSDMGSGPWGPRSGGGATSTTISGCGDSGRTAEGYLPQMSMHKRNTVEGFSLGSGRGEVMPQSSTQSRLLSPRPRPSPTTVPPSTSNQSSPPLQPLSRDGSAAIPSVSVVPSALPIVPAALPAAQTRTHGSPLQSHNLSALGLIGEDVDVPIEEASRLHGNTPASVPAPHGSEGGGDNGNAVLQSCTSSRTVSILAIGAAATAAAATPPSSGGGITAVTGHSFIGQRTTELVEADLGTQSASGGGGGGGGDSSSSGSTSAVKQDSASPLLTGLPGPRSNLGGSEELYSPRSDCCSVGGVSTSTITRGSARGAAVLTANVLQGREGQSLPTAALRSRLATTGYSSSGNRSPLSRGAGSNATTSNTSDFAKSAIAAPNPATTALDDDEVTAGTKALSHQEFNKEIGATTELLMAVGPLGGREAGGSTDAVAAALAGATPRGSAGGAGVVANGTETQNMPVGDARSTVAGRQPTTGEPDEISSTLRRCLSSAIACDGHCGKVPTASSGSVELFLEQHSTAQSSIAAALAVPLPAPAVLQAWEATPRAEDGLSHALVKDASQTVAAASKNAATEVLRPSSRWALRKAEAIAAADSMDSRPASLPVSASFAVARAQVVQRDAGPGATTTPETVSGSMPDSTGSGMAGPASRAASLMAVITPEQQQLRELQEQLRRLRLLRRQCTEQGLLGAFYRRRTDGAGESDPRGGNSEEDPADGSGPPYRVWRRTLTGVVDAARLPTGGGGGTGAATANALEVLREAGHNQETEGAM